MMRGIKDDDKKTRWDLIPWEQLESVARVLTRGAVKYDDDNWQHVPYPLDRYFAALIRHVTAWKKGELIDDETGEPHLAHAICCVLFLMWFDDQGPESELDEGIYYDVFGPLRESQRCGDGLPQYHDHS